MRWFLSIVIPTAVACGLITSTAASAEEPFTCRSLSLGDVLDKAVAYGPTVGQANDWVQPGGGHANIEFDTTSALPKFDGLTACAEIYWSTAIVNKAGLQSGSRFEADCSLPSDKPRMAETLSVYSTIVIPASPDGSRKKYLNVRTGIPSVSGLQILWCDARIVVGLFKPSGEMVAAFNQIEYVSSRYPTIIITTLTILILYIGLMILVIFSVNAAREKQNIESRVTLLRVLDPLALSSLGSRRASASSLQILLFSVIVLYLLLYYLLRLGTLSDLSPTVLMLLGVSVVGANLARVSDRMRFRLSGQNYAWLKTHGWNTDPGRLPTKSELVMTAGEFDVAKFQMLAFSFVVAVAMVLRGSAGLATFQIPEMLLGLLGLSQAAYVASKNTGASTMKEYDDTLTEIRNTEKAFFASDPADRPGLQRQYRRLLRVARHLHQVNYQVPISKQDANITL